MQVTLVVPYSAAWTTPRPPHHRHRSPQGCLGAFAATSVCQDVQNCLGALPVMPYLVCPQLRAARRGTSGRAGMSASGATTAVRPPALSRASTPSRCHALCSAWRAATHTALQVRALGRRWGWRGWWAGGLELCFGVLLHACCPQPCSPATGPLSNPRSAQLRQYVG